MYLHVIIRLHILNILDKLFENFYWKTEIYQKEKKRDSFRRYMQANINIKRPVFF